MDFRDVDKGAVWLIAVALAVTLAIGVALGTFLSSWPR